MDGDGAASHPHSTVGARHCWPQSFPSQLRAILLCVPPEHPAVHAEAISRGALTHLWLLAALGAVPPIRALF